MSLVHQVRPGSGMLRHRRKSLRARRYWRVEKGRRRQRSCPWLHLRRLRFWSGLYTNHRRAAFPAASPMNASTKRRSLSVMPPGPPSNHCAPEDGQEDARYEPNSLGESLRIAEQRKGRLFVLGRSRVTERHASLPRAESGRRFLRGASRTGSGRLPRHRRGTDRPARGVCQVNSRARQRTDERPGRLHNSVAVGVEPPLEP